MDSKIKKLLEDNNVTYEFYEHEPVYTSEEAEKKTKVPGLSLKNLFLKAKDKDLYVLVTLPGNSRLNIKQLEAYYKVEKFSFATEKELLDKLNVKPGHVSPFHVMNADETVKYLISQEAWDSEKVNFHPEINSESIVVDHDNFEKILKALNHAYEIILFEP